MNDAAHSCPLCRASRGNDSRPLLAQTGLVSAFHDAFPSSPGHILVVPVRHVAKLSQLTAVERDTLWGTAMRLLTAMQDKEPAWDFTVGVNDGPAAGQTVPHVHLHIIPRQVGDTPDPRGGVRWVLPGTAAYWDAAGS